MPENQWRLRLYIQFEENGSLEALQRMLIIFEEREELTSIMILAGDDIGFDKAGVDHILKACTKPVFGGIFPQVIHEGKPYSKGLIVVGYTTNIHLITVPFLSSPDIDFDMLLEEYQLDDYESQTMFVFVDGFGKRIGALISALFNVFGIDSNYIGGGAGSLSFEQKPVIFTNSGLVADVAVVGLSQHQSGLGVAHGWTSIGGPFKVSGSEHNQIRSLDWIPAFDVYKTVVEMHSGKTFDDNNFFDIAKAYPFGLTRLEGEQVVRDPISTDPEKALTCVGEVPQDEFVHILHGDRNSLISAAGQALETSLENHKNRTDDDFVFVIDCISRVLFLEDDFQLEMEAVSKTGLPLFGALTLGEIANSGESYIEFLNKTCVVGLLSP